MNRIIRREQIAQAVRDALKGSVHRIPCAKLRRAVRTILSEPRPALPRLKPAANE